MTDLEQVAASHGFTAVKSEPISEVEGTVHLMPVSYTHLSKQAAKRTQSQRFICPPFSRCLR